jgi:hypothetical protein
MKRKRLPFETGGTDENWATEKSLKPVTVINAEKT